MKENMNNEVLLFIESVNNKDIKANNQIIYDSRYKQDKKVEIKKHNNEFYVKINRLILMYNKNKKITCKIILTNNEQHNVIVTNMKQNILNCINIKTNTIKDYNINEIEELLIDEI